MSRTDSSVERVFVALGTNLGDRLLNLDEAVRRVSRLDDVRVVARGPVLDTAPLVEPSDPFPQPRYLNSVIELDTWRSPRSLLEALLAVERSMGRVRSTRWAPRIIDLDLLLFGERILDELGLQLPHPGLASRRFALEPLVALAPGLRHPSNGQPLRVLLERLPAC